MKVSSESVSGFEIIGYYCIRNKSMRRGWGRDVSSNFEMGRAPKWRARNLGVLRIDM